MIASIVFGSLGLVATLAGMKCSKVCGENYVLKGRIAAIGGAFFLLQGKDERSKSKVVVFVEKVILALTNIPIHTGLIFRFVANKCVLTPFRTEKKKQVKPLCDVTHRFSEECFGNLLFVFFCTPPYRQELTRPIPVWS